MLAAVLAAAVAGLVWHRMVDRIVEVGPPARPTIGTVYFGGPDLPPGRLRALLLDKVRSAPAGSRIDWATYYFLDRPLARALIAASDRGVRVTLVVEGNPRFAGANDPVLALLQSHGLNGGLKIKRSGDWPLKSGKLHAKIYAFSHPAPTALVGSFNPSGGPGADRAVLSDIGDQDRGHNLLVEVTDPGLVAQLRAQVSRLSDRSGWTRRLRAEQNHVYRSGETQLQFYPRIDPIAVNRDVSALGRGDRVWAAVSHLDDTSVSSLTSAAGKGATIRLIVHHTERRVPQDTLDDLAKAGIAVRRYHHPEGLPMHAKFFLIEDGRKRIAYFGSFNFNRASRHFNDEVLMRSSDPGLFRALLQRFGQIEAEMSRFGKPKAG